MLILVLKLIKSLLEEILAKFTQVLYCSEDIKQDRDIVTMVEQEAEMVAAVELVPEVVRLAVPAGAQHDSQWSNFFRCHAETLLLSPSFTLRGGTREILRGVIARGLGLR